MTTYQCGGVRIESALPLSAPPTSEHPDFVFVEGGARPVPPEPAVGTVVAERIADGVRLYTISESGTRTVIRFHGYADFEVDSSEGRIVSYLAPGVNGGMASVLLAGTVTAYLLSMAGYLVLHASAVEIEGGALAFVGNSGQGKTTLAALFCASGHRLVTDDVLPVTSGADGPVTCLRTGNELRLRPKAEPLLDHFSPEVATRPTADSRHGVLPAVTTADRLPLRLALIPLPNRERDRVTSERLSTTDAVMALSYYQRVEGWRQPQRLKAHFEAVTRVATSVPVYAVEIPWGPPFPKDLADDVLAAIGVSIQKPVGEPQLPRARDIADVANLPE